jgi:hypothetical protein
MPKPPDVDRIVYTPEERMAVSAAETFHRALGARPLCPRCRMHGHLFGLGEHLAVTGDEHVVTWRCDRGHVLSCAEFLETTA